MPKPLTLDDAIIFFASAHRGQKDKGGNSYFLHILRVALKMETEDEMVPALGHDYLEDVPDASIEKLVELGCTESQIMIIDALTKKEGQTNDEYIRGILKSPLAKKIKIADIEDNMTLWRMKNRHDLGEKDLLRINKYMKNWSWLKGI